MMLPLILVAVAFGALGVAIGAAIVWRASSGASADSVTALAVERTKTEFLDRELVATRERLARIERQFERLRDQLLANQGHIREPLAEHAPPQPPAHPLAGVMHAFGLTEYDPREPVSTPSEAAMPVP